MGYDLHITRATDWSQSVGFEISVAEWIDLVDKDPQLESDSDNGAYAAVWADETGAVRGWFDWYAGAIFTTNPDQATLGKLLEMARQLKARVQGDDGELYKTTDDWRAMDS